MVLWDFARKGEFGRQKESNSGTFALSNQQLTQHRLSLADFRLLSTESDLSPFECIGIGSDSLK